MPSTADYAFKLDGLDKKWTYLKTNRKAYFTELPPGNYSFVVKNLDDKNEPNNVATLDIEILPPFYAGPSSTKPKTNLLPCL